MIREKNLTQADVAELIGCSAPTIISRLSGRSKFDSDELELLADTFECEIDDFFDRVSRN